MQNLTGTPQAATSAPKSHSADRVIRNPRVIPTLTVDELFAADIELTNRASRRVRSGIQAALTGQPVEADPICMCGCPQSVHACKTHRGICYTCYGASDHGMRPYCNRYRRPRKGQH